MSAGPDHFLDSNVLVYAFTNDARAEVAQALLERGGVIGVQCLNEFANVARRKLGMSWPEVHQALAAVRTLCPTVLSMDVATHAEGLRLAERYGFALFDALIIATALGAGCRRLLSEDMQHGMTIEGRLRLIDPFRPPAP